MFQHMRENDEVKLTCMRIVVEQFLAVNVHILKGFEIFASGHIEFKNVPFTLWKGSERTAEPTAEIQNLRKLLYPGLAFDECALIDAALLCKFQVFIRYVRLALGRIGLEVCSLKEGFWKTLGLDEAAGIAAVDRNTEFYAVLDNGAIIAA